MSEELKTGLGPSGEDPNATEGGGPNVDPATGHALPAGIGGITLTPNFNSSRSSTWPERLTRAQVDAWIDKHQAPSTGEAVAAELGVGEQPVPPVPEGFGVMHPPQAPIARFLPSLPEMPLVDGVPTHPVMVSISEKLDLLAKKVALNVPDDDTLEILTEVAYSTYSEEVGGKAFNGDPLPPWSEFGSDPSKAKQANAWRASIKAVFGLYLIGRS